MGKTFLKKFAMITAASLLFLIALKALILFITIPLLIGIMSMAGHFMTLYKAVMTKVSVDSPGALTVILFLNVLFGFYIMKHSFSYAYLLLKKAQTD